MNRKSVVRFLTLYNCFQFIRCLKDKKTIPTLMVVMKRILFYSVLCFQFVRCQKDKKLSLSNDCITRGVFDKEPKLNLSLSWT